MQIHAFSGKNGKDLNIVPAQIWHSVNVATVCQLALWQKTEIVFFSTYWRTPNHNVCKCNPELLQVKKL